MKLKKITFAKEIKEIQAKKDRLWRSDLGFFLIRINPEKERIEVGFCNPKFVMTHVITGRNPESIYRTIIRKKLISRFEHAAYLGMELEKAYVSLKLGLPYVQDSRVNLKKK